jgi:acyl-CoA thioester hydrolase
MKLDFYKQIHHPQKVQIGIRVSRLGSKSFDYEYGLFLVGDNDCAIKCVTTLVCFDYVAQKTVPVFDVIKEQME